MDLPVPPWILLKVPGPVLAKSNFLAKIPIQEYLYRVQAKGAGSTGLGFQTGKNLKPLFG
jgi:hypothetical protein